MTSELEKRVIRRISLRIVPFIMLLYFIAYIDRVNIGFAALQMNQDLGFSSSVFGFGGQHILYRVLPIRSAFQLGA